MFTHTWPLPPPSAAAVIDHVGLAFGLGVASDVSELVVLFVVADLLDAFVAGEAEGAGLLAVEFFGLNHEPIFDVPAVGVAEATGVALAVALDFLRGRCSAVGEAVGEDSAEAAGLASEAAFLRLWRALGDGDAAGESDGLASAFASAL